MRSPCASMQMMEHTEYASSQSTRQNPRYLPDPEGKEVRFPILRDRVQNIYATLTVRLSHSGLFKKERFVEERSNLHNEDGWDVRHLPVRTAVRDRASLCYFFDQEAREEARFPFRGVYFCPFAAAGFVGKYSATPHFCVCSM